MNVDNINIRDYDYFLPEERIAKYPLPNRDESKLLIFNKGKISHTRFNQIDEIIAPESLLVFNNTKVIRARVIFHKKTGAQIEIFCLEPADPVDYEKNFQQTKKCEWFCMVRNLRKWKSEVLSLKLHFNNQNFTLWASKKR